VKFWSATVRSLCLLSPVRSVPSSSLTLLSDHPSCESFVGSSPNHVLWNRISNRCSYELESFVTNGLGGKRNVWKKFFCEKVIYMCYLANWNPISNPGIQYLLDPICVMMKSILHCISVKVPTFKLSVTSSNLRIFKKSIRHYPPHFRHVATLPWAIKQPNFSRYSACMDVLRWELFWDTVYILKEWHACTSQQIAGIILDNYARGRTKHVWFSMSSDLIVDARRSAILYGVSKMSSK